MNQAPRRRVVLLDHTVLADYRLTPYEGWLYVWLVSFTNRKVGAAWPSLKTLAARTGISRRKIIETLKGLEAKGLLRIERQHNRANRYFLLPVLPLASGAAGAPAPMPAAHPPRASGAPAPMPAMHPPRASGAPEPEQLELEETNQPDRTRLATAPSPTPANGTDNAHDPLEVAFGRLCYPACHDHAECRRLYGQALSKQLAILRSVPDFTLAALAEFRQFWFQQPDAFGRKRTQSPVPYQVVAEWARFRHFCQRPHDGPAAEPGYCGDCEEGWLEVRGEDGVVRMAPCPCQAGG